MVLVKDKTDKILFSLLLSAGLNRILYIRMPNQCYLSVSVTCCQQIIYTIVRCLSAILGIKEQIKLLFSIFYTKTILIGFDMASHAPFGIRFATSSWTAGAV